MAIDPKRPRGREKNITGPGKAVRRRGSGLGTGPVGSGSRVPTSPTGGGRRTTRSGGRRSPLAMLLLIAMLIFGGGGTGLLGGLLGEDPEVPSPPPSTGSQQQTTIGTFDPTTLMGTLGGGAVSSGWTEDDNTGILDTSVAAGARAKRTVIHGGGKDTVTVMVYMCGTDLESRSGMGTSDLQEMLAADIGDHVNLIVYTGGCSQWNNNVVSSKTNQIWQIKDGKLYSLVKDAGKVSMTDPDTLADFIQFCAGEFPANRNQLIFWDHGGGSISGYGYDEKYPKSGSMDLAGIDKALEMGGVTFDFIGFDACLMATLETALLSAQYGDYLLASEETEPGVGWYYTDWLTSLSKNPSMPTIEIGQQIIDDFVEVCAQKCRGQSTTLSIIDLAELEATVPAALRDFSRSTSRLIEDQDYRTVSGARSNAREFARSSRIDQVDLVHLAKNMGTDEGDALAEALLGAVKYNRTSNDMTNAYGISIYFPYRKTGTVDQAVATYAQIGMEDEYARCIQEFASLEVSGQAAAGGTASPLPSLLGNLMQNNSSTDSPSDSLDSAELLSQMLGSFLSGDVGSISGLHAGNTGFLSGRALGTEELAGYIAENHLDASALHWQNGTLSLSEDQWKLVQGLELNMFYDDGEGYIDLGLDNVFEFDENGALIGATDGTWLAINDQPVAYYHTSTVDNGTEYTIRGYVPAILNGQRVELILVFDDENPYGTIVGAQPVYKNGETDTVAKAMLALQPGDTLDFVCDYYGYDGTYLDSYYLGEAMTVTEEMTISNVEIDRNAICATYRFTDIYNQHYWTDSFR